MLVDDHPMWIDALSEDLSAVGFEIVAVAKNGTACLQRARATRPEVLVMDLQIPEPDGATCTEILVREFPDLHVLVISASGERDDVLRAMRAGATYQAAPLQVRVCRWRMVWRWQPSVRIPVAPFVYQRLFVALRALSPPLSVFLTMV